MPERSPQSGLELEQAPLDLFAGEHGSESSEPRIQQWLHPKANRSVALQVDKQLVRVGYHWIAAKRRTIGMQISVHGLQVRAPRWVSPSEVDATLQSRARWIVQKLGQLQPHPQDTSHTRLAWTDGAYIAWRGQWLRLALGFARRQASLQVLDEPEPLLADKHMAGMAAIMASPSGLATALGEAAQPGGVPQAQQVWHVLHLPLPLNAPEADIAAMAQRWLRQQAQQQLLQRSSHFAPLMGVEPSRLSLTSARTRWGSASSAGAIRLHWRLVQMDPVLFDYVLVHELAHLHEMNHSDRFWSWVHKVQPDYEAYRLRLKQVRLESWTL